MNASSGKKDLNSKRWEIKSEKEQHVSGNTVDANEKQTADIVKLDNRSARFIPASTFRSTSRNSKKITKRKRKYSRSSSSSSSSSSCSPPPCVRPKMIFF